jgi:hypothetical protein
LEWLHAFQSLERWKEEFLLLKEELLRLGAWHRYQIQTTTQMIREAEADLTLHNSAIIVLWRSLLSKLKNEADDLPYLCKFS